MTFAWCGSAISLWYSQSADTIYLVTRKNILGEIYYMTKFEEIDLVQTLWMNKMGIQLLGAESSKSLESMA